MSVATRRLRVTPTPPLAVHVFAAAREMAIAVSRVSSPSMKRSVGCQPVALLPQSSGESMKLSPPRSR